MATLQKIRDRAGLLIAVVIGLALLAFVLGDLEHYSQIVSMKLQKYRVNPYPTEIILKVLIIWPLYTNLRWGKKILTRCLWII